MSDAKYVNGNLISGASCTLKIDGQTIYGWEEISWDDKRKREKGAPADKGGPPRGRSSGNYEAGDLKIKFMADTCLAVQEQYAAASESGKSYGNPLLPIILQISEPGLKPITWTFHKCGWDTSAPSFSKKDPAVSMEEATFSMEKMDKNGLTLYDNEDDA